MPGDEQGQQLVAHLLVAHRAAVLVAGADQHREDVVALLQIPGPPPLGDLAVDQLVDPVDPPAEGPSRRTRCGPDQEHRQEEPWVGGEVEEVAQRVAQLGQPLALADAEDGAQDDLQRDRLHPRAQLVGGPRWPALDLACGDLGHRLPVALHPLAVEGRQQQATLAHVRLLVEDEDRVAAEDRGEDLVSLAGVEDARVAGEDLLDRLGVGEHHPGALVGDLQREHVAVAVLAGEQHPPRLARPDRGLHRAGQWRARRKASLGRSSGRPRSRCRRCLHSPPPDGTPA